MQRQPRIKNDEHLAFIRQLECCVCMDNTSTEAAHIRMADDRAAKRYVGKGEKADDRWTVPLCGKCHRLQHAMSEHEFWGMAGIDPVFLALALWGVTGNYELGLIVLHNKWAKAA